MISVLKSSFPSGGLCVNDTIVVLACYLANLQRPIPPRHPVRGAEIKVDTKKE